MGLMFVTRSGTPFLHRNIERYFKKTLVRSGLLGRTHPSPWLNG